MAFLLTSFRHGYIIQDNLSSISLPLHGRKNRRFKEGFTYTLVSNNGYFKPYRHLEFGKIKMSEWDRNQRYYFRGFLVYINYDTDKRLSLWPNEFCEDQIDPMAIIHTFTALKTFTTDSIMPGTTSSYIFKSPIKNRLSHGRMLRLYTIMKNIALLKEIQSIEVPFFNSTQQITLDNLPIDNIKMSLKIIFPHLYISTPADMGFPYFGSFLEELNLSEGQSKFIKIMISLAFFIKYDTFGLIMINPEMRKFPTLSLHKSFDSLYDDNKGFFMCENSSEDINVCSICLENYPSVQCRTCKAAHICVTCYFKISVNRCPMCRTDYDKLTIFNPSFMTDTMFKGYIGRKQSNNGYMMIYINGERTCNQSIY
jgi:hypothetical protein